MLILGLHPAMGCLLSQIGITGYAALDGMFHHATLRRGRSPPTFRLRRHLSTVDAPHSPPAGNPVFPLGPDKPDNGCAPVSRSLAIPPGTSELRQGVSKNEMPLRCTGPVFRDQIYSSNPRLMQFSAKFMF
jgi:hypothetical protein